jgi:hypothetical protein
MNGTIDWDNDYWISVRNRWPRRPGKYKIMDCRCNAVGKATYDGFEWHDVEMHKGLMLVVPDIITHWQDNE